MTIPSMLYGDGCRLATFGSSTLYRTRSALLVFRNVPSSLNRDASMHTCINSYDRTSLKSISRCYDTTNNLLNSTAESICANFMIFARFSMSKMLVDFEAVTDQIKKEIKGNLIKDNVSFCNKSPKHKNIPS